MAYVGGDIVEVTCNHPTAGDKVLQCKAAEDSTIDLGGYVNNDDDNGVSGAGEAVYVKNRKRWSIELAPVLHDKIQRDELSYLQNVADSSVEADWTVEFEDGTVWAGKGLPVGDLNATTSDPHITVKIAGGGRLQKIA